MLFDIFGGGGFDDTPGTVDGQGADDTTPTPHDQSGQDDGVPETPPNTDDGQGDAPNADDSNTDDGVAGWQQQFSSPEELYAAYTQTKKSYDNLRPKLTQTTQQLSDLMRQQMTANEPQPSGEDDVIGAVRQIIAPVLQQNAEIRLQNRVSQLSSEEDFNDVSPLMAQMLQDNPEIWYTKDPIGLAYKAARSEYLTQAMGGLAEEAKKQAYQNRQNKIATSDGVSKSTKMTQADKSEEQLIAESILAAANRNSIFL